PHTHPLSLHDALPICILEHTHGRRDETELAPPEAPSGRVAQLPRERQKVLARWFRHCRKGRDGDDDGVALTAINAILAEIEHDLDRKSTRLNSSHVSI